MPSSRRLLQTLVAVLALVPISAGLAGVTFGPLLINATRSSVGLDSHFRYLSGLLLAIGLAFWAMIPAIERRTTEFRLLTFIVFIGGIGRLVSLATLSMPSLPMQGALVMELAVTPILCLWQNTLQGKR